MAEKFWAISKAEEIVNRKNYHFLDKKIPEFKEYVIKSSASLSGVLHIGRLSDTLRGESVCLALKELGYRAKLIWVAEDMDPLRKVPRNVPESYEEYIGMPVSNIPCPYSCHRSYAEHFEDEYFEVLHKFLKEDFESYSMKEEYAKGNFAGIIKTMIEKIEELKGIQQRYRDSKLPQNWFPWLPICKNCGKIITPRVKKIENSEVYYKCEDYGFEKTLAKGCGYEGTANPLRDAGKLLWKSEWAAQWKRFKVASEGAGKEYIVPNSAFWVNAEICERILDFPSPVPVFYEHLLINGEKMSASLGNVIYPKDWLEFAPPDLLRYLYNKKPLKARSFSWRELPKLYDEFDRIAGKYFKNELSEADEKLFEYSNLTDAYSSVSFSMVSFLAGIYREEKTIIEVLKRTKHYNEKENAKIRQRIRYAISWVNKHGNGSLRIISDEKAEKIKQELDEEQREFLNMLRRFIEESRKSTSEEMLQNKIYEVAKKLGINTKKAFEAIYLIFLGEKRGPKAGFLLASLDRDFVLKRLKT